MRGEWNEKTEKLEWVLENTDEKGLFICGLVFVIGLWIAIGVVIASMIFNKV